MSCCTYFSRLKILGLDPLKCRRLNYDLVLYYKILNGYCDMVLTVAPGSSVTRGNNCNFAKQTSSIDIRKFCYGNIIVDAWNSYGLPNLVYFLHHQLTVKSLYIIFCHCMLTICFRRIGLLFKLVIMVVFSCFFLLPHFILVNKDFPFNSQGPAGEKGDRGDGELPFYDDNR